MWPKNHAEGGDSRWSLRGAVGSKLARMSSRGDSGASNGFQGRSYVRPCKCKVCGKEFASGQSLGGHMNVHRNKRSSESMTPDADSRGYRSLTSSPLAEDVPYTRSYSESSPGSDTSVEYSPYKGVRFRKEQSKWVAEIRPPKSDKTWWLGTYATPEEAAYAYDVAICYFGSDTALNFEGHPLYEQLPAISPDLPKQDYAIRLRKVVKDVARQAMADRGLQTDETHERGESSNVAETDMFDDRPLDISEVPIEFPTYSAADQPNQLSFGAEYARSYEPYNFDTFDMQHNQFDVQQYFDGYPFGDQQQHSWP